jgi:ribosomal protein L16 Arg81 hydroxylase
MTKLNFDLADFRDRYERTPFVIRHDLHQHPLLKFERLMELSRQLPEENIELNAGNVPKSLVEGRKPTHEMTPDEVIHRIRDCNTWLGLKKVVQVPEYRALVDDVLEQLRPAIDVKYPGMYARDAFIFVTSPRSMVPYHMDPEHNFLFQISGGKSFTIFDRFDRDLLPEEEIERHYTQENRKMVLPPQLETRGRRISLAPGDALHVPINAPHFVENDGEISISISITFRTPRSDQREILYQINHRLRSLGLRPRPIGQSPSVDLFKMQAYRAYRVARGLGSPRAA